MMLHATHRNAAHTAIPFPKARQACKPIGNKWKYVLSSLPAFFHGAKLADFPPRGGSALSDHILSPQGIECPRYFKVTDLELIKVQ